MYRYKRLFAVLAFIALLLVLVQVFELRENFSLAYLHQKFLDHRVGGLLIFVALFALGNLMHIPGLIFLAAAVLALGEVWGGLATYLGALVASVFTFCVVRLIGGNALRQVNGAWPRYLLARLDAHPITSMALLRVLVQTLPALNVALALSGVRFRHYLAAAALGLPLPIALYCVFFDYVARSLHIPGY